MKKMIRMITLLLSMVICFSAVSCGTNDSGDKTLYELAVEAGYQGSEAEWEALLSGSGKTLYELAVDGGYQGSEKHRHQAG